nr:acetoacetate decarboxylase family protein [Cupriavidus necator]
MPYGFGPTAGPRQGPDLKPFDWSTSPHRLSVAVSFLTEANLLSELLPPGFRLEGDPVVTVELTELSELEWLAGRGYSMLGVRFPARFQGTTDDVTGSFLSVLWENLADPILSGREELGYAKLWCELPPARIFRNKVVGSAAWLTHQFAEISVDDLTEAELFAPAYPGLEGLKSDGTLHYKYVPDTQNWGAAALAHPCLSPAGGSVSVERVRRGRGNVSFFPTTWEDMPTQFHIVTKLMQLPQLESRGAWVAELRGASDLSNQRKLA